jgi:hypothetical protein
VSSFGLVAIYRSRRETMRLKVESVAISSLIADPNNPRRMSGLKRSQLRNSIEAYGFVVPIVVRKPDRVVIGGHQRLQAARELGLTDVPVVWWEGDDRQAKALNLALNQIEGEWDERKLAAVLADLAGVESLSDALGGFDTSWTNLAGFSTKDVLVALDANLNPEGKEEGLALLASSLLDGRDDHQPTAKVGDAYTLGNHRLLCGDARDPSAVVRLCNQLQPAALVTDPPYNVAYAPDSQALARGLQAVMAVAVIGVWAPSSRTTCLPRNTRT